MDLSFCADCCAKHSTVFGQDRQTSEGDNDHQTPNIMEWEVRFVMILAVNFAQ